jgi:hypothetical protein
VSGVNNLLVIAGIGAAGNLIRNLLLTSDATDWPLSIDRITSIKNQYPRTLQSDMSGWWDQEGKLRFWNDCYGIDLNLEANYGNYKLAMSSVSLNKPAVFINHTFLWDSVELTKFLEVMTAVYCAPTTDIGLEWQIRALHNKLGTKSIAMMDFSFRGSDRDKQIEQYIQEHGKLKYLELNKINMKDILKRQQQQLASVLHEHGVKLLPLEALVSGDTSHVLYTLENIFSITFDHVAEEVLNAWRDLHWEFESTYDWDLNEFV